MPLRAPSAAPLSSRGVLLTGALALLCLALFAALLFEAIEPAPPALALDGPSPAVGASAPAVPADDAQHDAPAVVFPDDPDPIPSGVLTALERAGEEPIEAELTRLLDALQHGFGARSVQVEPTLRPYASRLADRLNAGVASYRVFVAAPDPALAEARAATLRNLIDAAGVAAGRLTVVVRRGAPALRAEPA